MHAVWFCWKQVNDVRASCKHFLFTVAYAGFFNGGALKSDIKIFFAIYTLANK